MLIKALHHINGKWKREASERKNICVNEKAAFNRNKVKTEYEHTLLNVKEENYL